MKSKDIKVGETYGYTTWIKSSYPGGRYLEKVKVLSVEKGSALIKCGSREKTVPLRQIVCPWAEHEEALRAREEFKARTQAQREAISQQIRDILGGDALLEKHFLSAAQAHVYLDGSYSHDDRISPRDLLELLQVAYDNGRAQAQSSQEA